VASGGLYRRRTRSPELGFWDTKQRATGRKNWGILGFIPSGGKLLYRPSRAAARILTRAADHSSPASCFLQTEEGDDSWRRGKRYPARWVGPDCWWAALVGFDQVSYFLFFLLPIFSIFCFAAFVF
jgi:hypothetical protein